VISPCDMLSCGDEAHPPAECHQQRHYTPSRPTPPVAARKTSVRDARQRRYYACTRRVYTREQASHQRLSMLPPVPFISASRPEEAYVADARYRLFACQMIFHHAAIRAFRPVFAARAVAPKTIVA